MKPPKGWRWLNPGEVLKRSDKYFCPAYKTWENTMFPGELSRTKSHIRRIKKGKK